MRFPVLLILGMGLALFSCKKTTVIETYKPKPLFRVGGLHSYAFKRTAIRQFAIAYYRLRFSYESGDPQLLQLSIEDSSGFLVTTLATTSGYPDFESEMQIQDAAGPHGVYTLNLVVKSGGDSVQRFPFQITVFGDTTCTGLFTEQRFVGTSNCPDLEVYAPIRVRRLHADSDTLLFEGMYSGINIKMVPDCDSQKMLLPPQMVNGTRYEGGGDIVLESAAPSVNIYLKIQKTTGTTVENCFYKLQSR